MHNKGYFMQPSDFADVKPPKLQDIECNGAIIPRKEFKASIAVIAKDFSDGKIDDVVMAKFFARREVNFQKIKKLQNEFKDFQIEYAKKTQGFAQKIISTQAVIEDAEVTIYERKAELNHEDKQKEE